MPLIGCHQWLLNLGAAGELLPNILPVLSSIDMSIRNSLHTYDHIKLVYKWEYPHIRDRVCLCEAMQFVAYNSHNLRDT